MALNDSSGVFLIRLQAEDNEDARLPDISSFLYDTNLLYEFIRVVVDEQYARYKFNRFSGYRNNHRVDPKDQLLVYRLRKESPLHAVLLALGSYPAARAIKIFVETLERAVNISVKHRILKLTEQKLQRELAAGAPDIAQLSKADTNVFREQIRSREGEYYIERVEKHLQQNPIRITSIDVKHLPGVPAPGSIPEDDDKFDDEQDEGSEE